MSNSTYDIVQQAAPQGEIILYQPDETVSLEVRVDHNSVWLTQAQMAELFNATKQNVSLHIRNIYEEGELEEVSTVKEYLTVRKEGDRMVRRNVNCYNLERQVDSSDYERTLIGGAKLSTLSRVLPTTVTQNFKEQYVLDFLNLGEPLREDDLQKGLVREMKRFILELGKDFLFMGDEYRLQVGGKDFYIDLLFYHRSLRCLVAFELKTTDFKPEYLGQLNFYLEALDRDVKKPGENPSIGVLLCKGKDDEVVEYALSRSMSPTMVSQYELALPNKEILQAKLRELGETNVIE